MTTQAPLEISVSLTPAGDGGVNVIVTTHALRILLLDCRSGLPLAQARVAAVEVDGTAIHSDRTAADAADPLVTDATGVVVVEIPHAAASAASFTLMISFRDVAALPEASLAEYDGPPPAPPLLPPVLAHRAVVPDMPEHTAAAGATGFSAEWTDSPQSGTTAAPGWGWRLRPGSANTDERNRLPEFKSHVTWTLSGSPEKPGDWCAIQDASRCFSMFFGGAVDQPELVLFALTYCQPIFYEPPATATHQIVGTYSATGTAELLGDPRPSMYMITKWNAHADASDKGRDFGTFVPTPSATGPRYNKKHEGIDLAGINGQTPVFAVCGGKVTVSSLSAGGYGYNVVHDTRRANYFAHYAHFSAQATVAVNDRVRAGKRLGLVGRTFNGTATYQDAPTHLHFEVGTPNYLTQVTPRDVFAGDDAHADASRALIPDNSMNRLFPCDCSAGTTPGSLCRIRGSTNTTIANTCWARQLAHCPYLAAGSILRFQAQLKYLNLYTGSIDASWGNGCKAAISAFRQAHLQELPDLGQTPTADVLEAAPAQGSDTANLLDGMAPYPIP
jgi:murein DD-endopeptidase MepM/ murein hydrolase activator NlpD